MNQHGTKRQTGTRWTNREQLTEWERAYLAEDARKKILRSWAVASVPFVLATFQYSRRGFEAVDSMPELVGFWMLASYLLWAWYWGTVATLKFLTEREMGPAFYAMWGVAAVFGPALIYGALGGAFLQYRKHRLAARNGGP